MKLNLLNGILAIVTMIVSIVLLVIVLTRSPLVEIGNHRVEHISCEEDEIIGFDTNGTLRCINAEEFKGQK